MLEIFIKKRKAVQVTPRCSRGQVPLGWMEREMDRWGLGSRPPPELATWGNSCVHQRLLCVSTLFLFFYHHHFLPLASESVLGGVGAGGILESPCLVSLAWGAEGSLGF